MKMHVQELKLADLIQAFDRLITFWHSDPADYKSEPGELNPIALELGWRNYSLWHEEDKARRTDVDDSMIAQVKRNIDGFNQQRNDLIEKLDEAILAWLTPKVAFNKDLPINSETPGSIVDRIFIMSLKVYHMHEDTLRDDIDDAHRSRSQQKLATLREQRADLEQALHRLLDDYLAGNRKMKLYRQFKMYNDPTLNPELYRQTGA
ncbi:protein of unknown function DUF4254 [Geoanaerobacter pelophilus]|uniref:DUF4254 domain-containing protein n=2 Tax=Geoanaerobacter pelophilus TaxID=60036 RepID=A0ABQ0MPP9_9BACT|nr:protein of unknown function DUF4254 [Geoanaerobacter pelophilus]